MASVDSASDTTTDPNKCAIVPYQTKPISFPIDPSTFYIEFGPSSSVNLHLPFKPLSTFEPLARSYFPTFSRYTGTLRPSRQERRIKHQTASLPWLKRCPSNRRNIFFAAMLNRVHLMRNLLKCGISANLKNDTGCTPLHIASKHGYVEIVQVLLEYEADPNVQDNFGSTPLHMAAQFSYIPVVALLLHHGANAQALNLRGLSPLQLAEQELTFLKPLANDEIEELKQKVQGVIHLLITHLKKQKDTNDKIEALTPICSRLSLSSTCDQIQDQIKLFAANLNELKLTN